LAKGIQDLSNEGEMIAKRKTALTFFNLLQNKRTNFNQTPYKSSFCEEIFFFQIKGQMFFKGKIITKRAKIGLGHL
jgi:hypothetical protein